MSDFKIVKLLNPITITTNINPTGAYNPATSYGIGDVVSYGNSSYICIQPTTGNVPTNTTYWQLLASASTNKLSTTARNTTGSTIPAGSVVYFSGASGNLPLLALSQANAELTSTKTIGITAVAINNNATGEVVVVGLADNLNTSAYPDGSALWLSPTVAGGVTLTKPSAPNHAVFVGFVTRSHPSAGTIEVKIQNGYELEELHNVAISGPTTGQTITYNSATSLWSNHTLTKSDVGLGNVQNLDQTDPNNIIQDSTHRFVTDTEKSYWNGKEDALGFTPENVSNKDNGPLSTSTTTYPTSGAVKTYVDTSISSAATPDATTTVKGKVKLAGDLSGTADLPTVPGLAGKEPTISSGTTADYWRGDKSWQVLDKNAVGLGNVDNTSDLNKPISTATQTALNTKVSYTDMQKTQLAYVSPSGSNATGDGSLAKPYQTVAYAIANTLDGTTIFLLPGLYTEPTIVIPAGTGSRSFKGFSAPSTELVNGISHTSGAVNTGFAFDAININSATLNESAAVNGFIYFTRCYFSLTRTDSNPNVVFTSTESNITTATISGATNIFNEALVISTITASGGFNIFENCKFVTNVEAQGNAMVRMMDCELFGATNFINGTIVSGNTPAWQVDLATDSLGGYTGSINKTYLANITGALGYTPATFTNTIVSALIFG